MTEIGVQLPEIGVQLRPKPVFNFARNRCSTSSEKPNHGGNLTERCYARSCERVDGGWTDRRRRPCLQRLQWDAALCRRHVGSVRMLAHDLDVDDCPDFLSPPQRMSVMERARQVQGLAGRRVRRARPSEPRAGTVAPLSVRTLTGGDVGIGRDVRPSYVQVGAGARMYGFTPRGGRALPSIRALDNMDTPALGGLQVFELASWLSVLWLPWSSLPGRPLSRLRPCAQSAVFSVPCSVALRLPSLRARRRRCAGPAPVVALLLRLRWRCRRAF